MSINQSFAVMLSALNTTVKVAEKAVTTIDKGIEVLDNGITAVHTISSTLPQKAAVYAAISSARSIESAEAEIATLNEQRKQRGAKPIAINVNAMSSAELLMFLDDEAAPVVNNSVVLPRV